MIVKLNVLVFCVMLVHFSECSNCDDVFKCVTDWVAAALAPNSNVTVEIIEDIPVNVTTSNKPSDGNLLTDFSTFLAEKLSNLVKENPSMDVLDSKTKIYVQTFKINDSIFENKTITMMTTTNPDLIESDNDKNTQDHIQNAEKKMHIITAEEESTTSNIYKDLFNITEINIEYNSSVITQPMTQMLYSKTDKITKNSIDGSGQNITSKIQLEYSTYNPNYINDHDKKTTAISLNTEDIAKTNDLFYLTTEKALITESTVTTEGIENNTSGAKSLSTPKNIFKQELSVYVNKDDSLKSNIHNNYIDDVYDFHGDIEIDIGESIPDNSRDYLDIDYTDIYKDTTNEDAEYTPAVYIPTTTEAVTKIINKEPTDGIDSAYSWIATVFVMNGESKQFEYICDGSLVSERVVLTAARCVLKANVTVDIANILIILGKRSLQAMGPNEIVLRVKSIKVHDNFVSTEGKVDNDLAVVFLAEPVLFNNDVRPAPLGAEDKSAPLATATTGWHVTGALRPLYLEPQSTDNCMANANPENYLCGTLGDNETTCPSYGGLLLDRQNDNQWRLKGVASGNPTSKGVCFNKHLTFTKIENHLDWILKNVKEGSSE